MKITIIGGGSTYTPELIDGFLHTWRTLGLTEVVLMDIDRQRLDVVANFAARMAAHASVGFTVRASDDLEDAIAGATFISTQLRVGQQPARVQDELLGLRHGLIGQETTGVGGFAKALRTIPAIKKLAEAVRQHAPEAWVINFTNPSGIITEALYTLGVERTVGLCNIPIGFQMDLAAALKVDADDVELDYAGLNHLAWVRHVRVKGVDVIDQVIEMIEQHNRLGTPANIEDMDYPPGFLKMIGALPSPYLRYFYMTDHMYGTLSRKPRTRGQEVMDIERDLLTLYRNPASVEKPEALSKRGGAYYSKIAVEIMLNLLSDEGRIQIVNTLAGDAFPGVGPRQSVEIPCRVSRAGVTPLPLAEPLAPHQLGLLQSIKAYETLTVTAALEHSYRHAWQALCVHPLCGPVKARAVLDDIIRTFGLTWLTADASGA